MADISKSGRRSIGRESVGHGSIDSVTLTSTQSGKNLSEQRQKPFLLQGSASGIEDVDLKRKFPCSKRKPFRLSFKQFVTFLFIAIVSVLTDRYLVSGVETDSVRNALQTAMLVFIFLTGINWLFAYWIAKLRASALKYVIRDGSVMITKGIFLKKSGCFHLSHITDVYLVQEQLDWLFNTCTLCISTANQSSGQFAFIEGFDEETAHNFQEYLLKQAEASSVFMHSTSQGYSSHGFTS